MAPAKHDRILHACPWEGGLTQTNLSHGTCRVATSYSFSVHLILPRNNKIWDELWCILSYHTVRLKTVIKWLHYYTIIGSFLRTISRGINIARYKLNNSLCRHVCHCCHIKRCSYRIRRYVYALSAYHTSRVNIQFFIPYGHHRNIYRQ
jgi:hypothetical protein